MKHNPFVPREQRTAILTFDNGQRVRAEITLPGTDKPVWHTQLERCIVRDFNKAQPRAVHKLVKVHLLLTTFHPTKHTTMNKKTIKQKLRNLKLKATALWWFLTRKNYYLLTYNKGCKSHSLESYNIDILSFIDQVQRWHNMLTAHDILVILDGIRKLGIEDILVRNEVKELIEKIKKQDRVYLGPEKK